MDSHEKDHGKNKMYECEKCKMKFILKNSLTRHQEMHSTKKFTCKFCSGKFMRNFNLTKHYRFHFHNKKDFECPVLGCNVHSKNYAESMEHLKKHQICFGREGNCKWCLMPFSRTGMLMAHFLIEHCSHEASPLPDAPCFRHRALGNPLTSPATEAVPDALNPIQNEYKCNACGITFTKVELFIVHSVIHSADDPWKCGLCGAKFDDKDGLYSHVFSGEFCWSGAK